MNDDLKLQSTESSERPWFWRSEEDLAEAEEKAMAASPKLRRLSELLDITFTRPFTPEEKAELATLKGPTSGREIGDIVEDYPISGDDEDEEREDFDYELDENFGSKDV